MLLRCAGTFTVSSKGVAGLVEMAPYPSICLWCIAIQRKGRGENQGQRTFFLHVPLSSRRNGGRRHTTGMPRTSDAARGERSARAAVVRAEVAVWRCPAYAGCGRTPWISPSSSSDSGNAASARTAQIRRSRPILRAADLRVAFARRSARPPEGLEPRPRSTGVRAHGAAHVDNISRVLARRGVRRASQCGQGASHLGYPHGSRTEPTDDAPTGFAQQIREITDFSG